MCDGGGPPGGEAKGTARAWARRSTGPRSVDTTGSGTARTCSDVSTRSPRCCGTTRSPGDEPMTGLEVELNLVRTTTWSPRSTAKAVLDSPRVAGVPDGAGPLEPRAQPAAAAAARRAVAPLRAPAARRAGDGPGQGAGPRRPAGRDRDPADAGRPPPRRGRDLPGRPLPRCSTSRCSPTAASRSGSTSPAATRSRRAPEHLVADFDSIAPEAACTSMQLHLQVPPEVFPAYWNAAQCLAGVQLAARRELAVPARCAAVGGDPDPAVRAVLRRAPARAAQPGRAAAGVVRRAVDHLGPRPVRARTAATSPA